MDKTMIIHSFPAQQKSLKRTYISIFKHFFKISNFNKDKLKLL